MVFHPQLPRTPVASSPVHSDTRVPPPAEVARTTSEELVRIVLALGGRVIARPLHGVLLEVRRHLMLVPSTHFVAEAALVDVLRAAGLSRARFEELRLEK
jgi:hypothetical protein